jgi:hypothetical protein
MNIMPQIQQLIPPEIAIAGQPPEHRYGLPLWHTPTIHAQQGDLLRCGVLLQVCDRQSYPNGNVFLTCSEQINTSHRCIYQSFLLDRQDELIACPNLGYGDVVTAYGTYVPFWASLPQGLRVSELLDHDGIDRAWLLAIDGQDATETIWQDGQGCQVNGQHYRGVHQAAIVIAEMISRCEPLTIPF